MFGFGGTAESEMLRAERRDLRSLLEELTDAQWETSSLCNGWTVHDIVAHITGVSATTPGDMLRSAPYLVGGYSRLVDHGNESFVGRRRQLTHRELLAEYVEVMGLDQGAKPTRIFGRAYTRLVPSQGLADAVIHQQDIRRPLELPRTIPAERLEVALDRVLASRFVFHGYKRARGLQFQATDIDLRRGAGPSVRGAAEALLMAVSGRTASLAELSGDGVDTLRDRIGSAA
jgi:uncharacterized protein (TIGR03083 family)